MPLIPQCVCTVCVRACVRACVSAGASHIETEKTERDAEMKKTATWQIPITE